MANWHYYNEDREKVGPITSKQLKKLAQHGIVFPETVVETDEGTIGLAKDVKGLVFGESMPPKATLRPHNEVGVVPTDTGEIYGVATPNLSKQTELAKRAEQMRLEAETSAIAAEVAAEKEAAATMRAANAIKAAAEKRAAEALKAADKMNAIAEKAERKLQQFATRSSTSGSNLLPGIVISILAMLLIGGVIGTVAWSTFSGTNSMQRRDNVQAPAARGVLKADNPFADANVIELHNPFEDPTVKWKTDNPFAD